MRVAEDRRPLRRSILLLLLMSSHRCCAALVGFARKITHTYIHAVTLNEKVKGKDEVKVSADLVKQKRGSTVAFLSEMCVSAKTQRQQEQ